jgi:hypothetical protein
MCRRYPFGRLKDAGQLGQGYSSGGRPTFVRCLLLSWCLLYAFWVPQYSLHALHMKSSDIADSIARHSRMQNPRMGGLGRRAPAKSFHHIVRERQTLLVSMRSGRRRKRLKMCRRASASLVSPDSNESRYSGIARPVKRTRPRFHFDLSGLSPRLP